MDKVGYAVLTEDGVLNTSGEPVAVYGFHILSGAGGNGSVVLRNGTTTGGTAVITEEGTQSQGVTYDFGGVGLVFPSGCFVDFGTNASAVTVFYERLK